MYVVKIPRSKYYQIVYFTNGKRTTLSTKTTNKREAYQFLEEFSSRQNREELPQEIPDIDSSEVLSGVPDSISQITTDKNNLTLSKFKEEYLEYCRPVKSKKYIDSIEFSFKQFVSFSGDLSLSEIDIRTVDKFIKLNFLLVLKEVLISITVHSRQLSLKLLNGIIFRFNAFTKIKVSKSFSKTFPVFYF